MKLGNLVLFFLFFSVTCSCYANSEVSDVSEVQFVRLISYDTPTTSRYAQGMDIYDGKVFQAFSDGTIDVYDLSSKELYITLGPFYDDKGVVLHMNDIRFHKTDGNILLMIPGNDVNSSILLFSLIQKDCLFSQKKEHTLPAPLIDEKKYKASTQYFTVNQCIQVAYKRTEKDWFGDIIVEGYTYNALNENIVYSKRWAIEHEQLWAMQGAVIVDNKCYLAVGTPQGDAAIYKIDINNGAISCFVDFRKNEDLLPNEEMQGISYYDNEFFFSTTYGLYKLLRI